MSHAITEDILVRPAALMTSKSCSSLKGMIDTERPFDATIKRGPAKYYDLPGLIASPDVEIVVAEFMGRTVASGYTRIEEAKP